MNYLLLNAVFLAAVCAVAALALSRRLVSRRLMAAGAIALGVVLVLTAIFDNIMIGVGLVDYDQALISGLKLGIAPIEDFAYPVAAAILLPSLWVLLGSGAPRLERSSEEAPTREKQ